MSKTTVRNFIEILGDRLRNVNSTLCIYNGISEDSLLSIYVNNAVFVDANNMPDNIEKFDLVFASGCLEYALDPRNFCSFMLDYVSDGGIFYLSTRFGGGDIDGLWRFTADGLVELFCDKCVEVEDAFYETDGIGVAIWGRKIANS